MSEREAIEVVVLSDRYNLTETLKPKSKVKSLEFFGSDKPKTFYLFI